jgi:hypothetical protein
MAQSFGGAHYAHTQHIRMRLDVETKCNRFYYILHVVLLYRSPFYFAVGIEF